MTTTGLLPAALRGLARLGGDLLALLAALLRLPPWWWLAAVVYVMTHRSRR